jgi:hypothetical protein
VLVGVEAVSLDLEDVVLRMRSVVISKPCQPHLACDNRLVFSDASTLDTDYSFELMCPQKYIVVCRKVVFSTQEMQMCLFCRKFAGGTSSSEDGRQAGSRGFNPISLQSASTHLRLCILVGRALYHWKEIHNLSS